MKIVVLDGYTLNPGDLSWHELESLGDVHIYDSTQPFEIIDRIGDAKYIFTNKTIIDANTLNTCPNLEFIGVLATGYNVVDTDCAKSLGIAVCNVPSYSTNAVAQFTFSLLLEIANSVAIHSTSVKNGEWASCKHFSYSKTPLIELYDKTIGIIGFGNIGKKVATIANAFGMKVLVYSRTIYKEYESDLLKFVPLDTLLSNSDIISLHCPLSEQTKNIINKDSILKMKNGVIIINTSRGALIDEADLKKALDNNKVYFAGVDVVSEEPILQNNPLLDTKNIYITPHIAWASYETRLRLLSIATENLKNYLDGNMVNRIV
jgi:glycerate dehydrogenase